MLGGSGGGGDSSSSSRFIFVEELVESEVSCRWFGAEQ